MKEDTASLTYNSKGQFIISNYGIMRCYEDKKIKYAQINLSTFPIVIELVFEKNNEDDYSNTLRVNIDAIEIDSSKIKIGN